MLKFYQKARGLKTQRHTAHQSSSFDAKEQPKINDIFFHKKRGKFLKKERTKESSTVVKMHAQDVILNNAQEEECSQMRHRLFNNAAIKQKLKDLQVWKAQQRIKRKMKRETMELAKCELSVHEYLVKKIKQNIEKSENDKLQYNQSTVFKASSQHKGQHKRYKTLNQQENTRKSEQFSSMITQNLFHKADLMKISMRREGKEARQSSNLISHDESLLAHIARKQKEFQDKSLRIVTVRNRSSLQHSSHKSPENAMSITNEKWHTHRQSQTKHIKSHSTRRYAEMECVVAMKAGKQSTQNLIKPWDSQSKFQ